MQKAIADIYNRVNLLRLQRVIATMEFYRPKVQILALEDVQAEYRRVAGGGILKQKALPYVLCLLEKAIAECVGLWVRREQFLCALGLYHGYMCEMRAGEGKSLVAVIAAVLCATRGKVHIVTVNDYLARRDSERFNGVYRVFGLKCAHNYRGHPDKRELYQSDVVYTSSHELIFDYLRDELEGGRRNIRSLNTAIIDEVDFVLLDNATSRFSVSSGSFYMPNVEEYRLAKEICSVLDGLEVKRNLNGDVYAERLRREIGAHYVYSFRDGSLYLTVVGLDFLSRVFQKEDLLLASPGFCRAILDTLRAKHFFVRGRDYLVEGDRIV
ncbi:MAG: hypothetical protein QMD10_10385, partial [Desulfitobacteriaceae bacterium]|nr:hypothetical protein [Desulfitobacteriaceae bacterium]